MLRGPKDLLYRANSSEISPALDVHVAEASRIKLTGAPVGAGSIFGIKIRYNRIQLARYKTLTMPQVSFKVKRSFLEKKMLT